MSGGNDGEDDAPVRPTIPRLDRKPSEWLKAEEVHTLLASVWDWYALERIRRVASEEVIKARDFLIENRATTNETGAELLSEEGWFPFVGSMKKSDDFAQIDNRRATLRYRAFGFGMCRFLGLLAREVLPEGSLKYFDDATNLAPLRIHEKLMGWKLEGDNTSSLTVRALRPAFLFSENSSELRIRNRELVFMTCLGMWEARRVGPQWVIRAGPIAYLFHIKAFIPALRHFEPLLGSPPPDKRAYARVVEETKKRLRDES